MMMAMSGGKKMEKKLAEIAKLGMSARELRVGFLENSSYPDGTPTAKVAAVQEFGGTINVPEHDTTVYRQVNAAGNGFNRQGRFVKQRVSNFSTTHTVRAHTITVPPRPFFRNMIAQNQGDWGKQLGALLVANNFDASKALGQMGMRLAGELQQSIVDTSDPPNAPSTLASKAGAKPLVDTGHMLNSVDFDVET